MGLILIAIGAIAGWKVAELGWRIYALIAGLALIPAAIAVFASGGVGDPLGWLSAWAVAFLYLAVPYSMLAFLKKKRLENREGE